ncbi:hypothetical protein OPV22_028830 [Ensete ventricosum]|uniref:Uncharacterized protein n=1 Tax=Ensete ventricosum TaxID=4639 RepID=A0AAV8Q9H8_ENSVE|nr:hypothetical protein OPV22_028830 [Ensete ventricosum]
MSFYRHLLLLRSLRAAPDRCRPLLFGGLSSPSRPFAFSSAEEAAAERRRRKRRLRIEPPLHALRRDPQRPAAPARPQRPSPPGFHLRPRRPPP